MGGIIEQERKLRSSLRLLEQSLFERSNIIINRLIEKIILFYKPVSADFMARDARLRKIAAGKETG